MNRLRRLLIRVMPRKHAEMGAHRKIVLVGQPNCGKSTLFNEVAGYRSVVSNFSGATVEYTRSHVKVGSEIYDLVDLPGTYSLSFLDEAEQEAQKFLLNRKIDVIINVVDASLLSRSLELTLQLTELEIPMVLCLNMMDEAARKGIQIDPKTLSRRLGIPVVATIASKGKGIRDLFETAARTAHEGLKARHIRGHRDVELIIARLSRYLKQNLRKRVSFSTHLLATKLLEQDPFFSDIIEGEDSAVHQTVKHYRKELAQAHGRSSDEVIAAERHSLSMSLFEEAVQIDKPVAHLRDRVDAVLMHPFWGYVFLLSILFLFFNLIFRLGGLAEAPLLAIFDKLVNLITAELGTDTLTGVIVVNAVQGLGGGIAIVLPYLFPFLMGLALLEDIGYLPRVAFLMDGLMHRIGLHGKAVIPAILGYGCNVPAVMATRILDSPRDRFIASFIAAMVPCAARMTIIFGLVGYYLGGNAALALYLINFVVIGLSGRILSRLLPEVTPGMILEMPTYQIPRLKSALMKTWFRMKDFIVIAMPLLVAGSIMLGFIRLWNISDGINRLLVPVTGVLGLPREVGITLIFGVLRKELSMLMLFQALGTQHIDTVLTSGQILVFSVFVIFYIPCVATMGALGRQIGWRGMALIVGFTFVLAMLMGVLTRGAAALIG